MMSNSRAVNDEEVSRIMAKEHGEVGKQFADRIAYRPSAPTFELVYGRNVNANSTEFGKQHDKEEKGKSKSK